MNATVTLANGDTVQSDDPRWQHECLARHVMRMPDLAARREWLADFEKRHGEVETERLRTTIRELWIGKDPA
jgi:hypothetical protein